MTPDNIKILIGIFAGILALAMWMRYEANRAIVEPPEEEHHEDGTFTPVSEHRLYLDLRIENILIKDEHIYFIYERVQEEY